MIPYFAHSISFSARNIEGRVPVDSALLVSNSVDVYGRFGSMSNPSMTVKNGEWYGVPYRCFVSQRVDGRLVAGRCHSAETLQKWEVLSSYGLLVFPDSTCRSTLPIGGVCGLRREIML